MDINSSHGVLWATYTCSISEELCHNLSNPTENQTYLRSAKK